MKKIIVLMATLAASTSTATAPNPRLRVSARNACRRSAAAPRPMPGCTCRRRFVNMSCLDVRSASKVGKGFWMPAIKTTVVGSYPVPTWLRVFSTRESLRDAMLAVIKTQELAGIDVVADGELYRWDINHAETNGMIDYFVRPLEGVQVELTLEQTRAWVRKLGMAYRARPAGIVTGPLGHGRLDLARDYALYRDLTPKPKKFTVTSPYMLAKVLDDA